MKWNDIPRERLSIIDNVGDISDQESLGYHSQIVYSCDSFFKYFDKYIQSRQSEIRENGSNISKCRRRYLFSTMQL